MTTAYNPASQWLTESLRDSAITQLADALDGLRIAREKRDALSLGDDASELIGDVYAATQGVLAVAQIVVRRHELLVSA